MNNDIQTIIGGLTPSQRAALRPFTTFSDSDGLALEKKGLLFQRDGVWFHTALGMQVNVELECVGK